MLKTYSEFVDDNGFDGKLVELREQHERVVAQGKKIEGEVWFLSPSFPLSRAISLSLSPSLSLSLLCQVGEMKACDTDRVALLWDDVRELSTFVRKWVSSIRVSQVVGDAASCG